MPLGEERVEAETLPAKAGKDAARIVIATRRRVPNVCLKVLALGLCANLWSTGAPAAAQPIEPEPNKTYAQEFHPVLKGNGEKTPELVIYGPDAAECVKFEPEGLRITLPVGYPRQRPGTGIVTDFGVKGDFEITVTFEILQEPKRAQAGQQTELRLVVVPNEPALPEVWHQANQNRAGLYRQSANFAHFSQFRAHVTKWNDDMPKDKWGNEIFTNVEQHTIHSTRTAAKAGRLRLVRSGPVLFFYASADPEKDFSFLFKNEFAAKDLKNVRVLASTGGPAASFDVRVTDLHIRADDFLRSTAATAQPAAGRNWLAISLTISLALVLLLGTWLYVRRRRRALALRRAIEDPGPAMNEGTSTAIVFRCSHCGKNLKAKSESAGKTLKCPKCGTAVHVPKTKTGDPKELP